MVVLPVWLHESVHQATYARSVDVLWRIGPDRVIVRPIGRDGRDLLGIAAMVWMALDEPRPLVEIEEEINALLGEAIDVNGTVAALVEQELIRSGDAVDT